MNGSRHRPSAAAGISQSGLALLLCLLLLTSLTLLGLSAASETVMQNKLTDNLRASEQARRLALAAQDWAEEWLLARDGPAPGVCAPPCTGLVVHAAGTLPPNPETLELSWWLANGHEAGVDPVSKERLATFGADGATPPVLIIEALHETVLPPEEPPGTQAWYRILVRGVNRTGQRVAVSASIVTRPWPAAGNPGSLAPGPCPGFATSARCGRVAWRALQ